MRSSSANLVSGELRSARGRRSASRAAVCQRNCGTRQFVESNTVVGAGPTSMAQPEPIIELLIEPLPLSDAVGGCPDAVVVLES